ncbi:hypothetical protein NDU88_009943 [Pleurodeles waltl]|uniref:Uncharacterized protein n=1 Tax=Pleurodeles waltl TaxID=8319 RepID=A0AAV7S1U3_PLEWA|nr:hypothetical protein NDU88_009943 [Pleurodeles waltl]
MHSMAVSERKSTGASAGLGPGATAVEDIGRGCETASENSSCRVDLADDFPEGISTEGGGAPIVPGGPLEPKPRGPVSEEQQRQWKPVCCSKDPNYIGSAESNRVAQWLLSCHEKKV